MIEPAEPARLPADQVTVGLTTKADRIRALANSGYLRTEIATLLDIRYQHVRYPICAAVTCRSGLSNEPDIPLDFRDTPSIGVVTESQPLRGWSPDRWNRQGLGW